MSASGLRVIHDAVQVNIAAGQIPGAVVLVARNGQIVHLEADGTAGPQSTTKLRVDTIFNIASLTKPITTVAILMLAERGKLRLDDPVSKYVPELGGQRTVRELEPGSPPPAYSPLPGILPATSEYGPARYRSVPAVRAITLRDLLTHTSGIQLFGVMNDAPVPKKGDTLATQMAGLGKLPLEFQPGSRWGYSSGLGFEVLGRVVEVASGQDFRSFLQQNVFGPLGMADTSFNVPRAKLARGLPAPPGMHPTTAEDTTYFSGAAGIASTVPDYFRFVQMLVDGGVANGHRFLTPETVHEMASNQIGFLPISGYPPMGMPAEGLRFGYGVLVLSNPAAAGTALPKGAFGWDGIGTRRMWVLRDQHIAILVWVPLVGPAAAPLQRIVESAVMHAIEQ